MFTAALLSRVKTWKQPKCPSTDEWIEKMQCIDTAEYHSATKKNETMPFAAIWMDLEITILSTLYKVKYYMLFIHEIQKMIQINSFTKQKQSHRLREQTCGSVQTTEGERWVGGKNQGVEINIYAQYYI